VLAPVGNDSALSAYGGWVVWSELEANGRWALTAWHRGAKTRLPVGTRSVPFDVDLGSDAHGRVVATYSRCATEPTPIPGTESVVGYASPNGLPRWSRASRCSLRVLDIATGRERALRVPRPSGASDTTPSMWRGRVAFARLARRATVAQVLLFTPSTGRLRRLRHGRIPSDCPFRGGCRGSKREGEVQQLDLGARAVAFVWDVRAPGVTGVGDGWELRADRLADGASRLFGSGYQSGACGARYPVSPNVAGDVVWFDEIRYLCDKPHTTFLLGDLTTGRYGRSDETSPQLAWQLARDGSAMYSIRGPRPPQGPANDPPCIRTAGPCQLVVDDHVPAPPADTTAHSPFF
jgi:hypothetical protein